MISRHLKILVVSLCSVMVSCESQPQVKIPNEIGPRKITLEVSSNKRNWGYVVTPSMGTVVESSIPLPDKWPPSADCYFQGSQVDSPDGRLMAKCFDGLPGKPPQFQVVVKATGTTTYQRAESSRDLLSFEWAPNSRPIALVTASQRRGNGPLELIWAGAGHPVPHVTIYVEIVAADGSGSWEYLVKRDVVYGRAAILNWR